jgi:hypothetical protein
MRGLNNFGERRKDMRYVAGIVIFLAMCTVNLSGQDTETVSAELVSQKVQDALVMASGTGLSGLHLEKAELTLEVGHKIEGGITVNLLIFTISNKKTKGSTQTATLTFDRSVTISGSRIPMEDLKEPLARAIAVTAAAASKINVLPLKEASIKLEFVVDTTAGGGVKFELLGGNIGGNVDFSKTSKNSLAVTFAR